MVLVEITWEMFSATPGILAYGLKNHQGEQPTSKRQVLDLNVYATTSYTKSVTSSKDSNIRVRELTNQPKIK